MDADKREFVISTQTKERVESAKLYIERRYSKLILQEKDKKENWDLLYKKMQSMNLSDDEQ
jgi:serine/threonine kinase 38